MSEQRPEPRMECLTCGVFFTTENYPKFRVDYVPKEFPSGRISKKKSSKGMPISDFGYFHPPCMDPNDPEKGRMRTIGKRIMDVHRVVDQPVVSDNILRDAVTPVPLTLVEAKPKRTKTTDTRVYSRPFGKRSYYEKD